MANLTGADFAYMPPDQDNAYGPPRVLKPQTPTTRQILPDEGIERPIATGITRRISE